MVQASKIRPLGAQARKRIEIAGALKCGVPVGDIMKSLNTCDKTIASVRKEMNGTMTPHHRKIRKDKGVSKTITKQVAKKIERLMKDKRMVGTRQVQKITGINRRSIQRHLLTVDWGRYVRAKIEPLLTEKNREDRLAWCRKLRRLGWNKALESTCWSDEMPARLRGMYNKSHMGCRWSGCEEKKPLIFKTKHTTVNFHCAAFITKAGISTLAILPGSARINSEIYQNIILKHYQKDAKRIFGNRPWLLQKDKAPAHFSKSTQAYKDDHSIPELLPGAWPGNSPDLNPIENCWSELKRLVAETEAKNPTQLKRALNRCWKKLQENKVHISCIDSLPDRVTACLEADGKMTKY